MLLNQPDFTNKKEGNNMQRYHGWTCLENKDIRNDNDKPTATSQDHVWM